MEITIKWQKKEVIFNEYTRAIDKWYKSVMYKDFNIGISEDIQATKFNPMTIEEANDYLVKNLTNLTEEEIQEISNADYNKVLEECKKLQTPPQKAKNS